MSQPPRRPRAWSPHARRPAPWTSPFQPTSDRPARLAIGCEASSPTPHPCRTGQRCAVCAGRPLAYHEYCLGCARAGSDAPSPEDPPRGPAIRSTELYRRKGEAESCSDLVEALLDDWELPQE